MEFKNKLMLYTLNPDYLKFLHGKDSEVMFTETYRNHQEKPFVGIVIADMDMNYFIPLIPAKAKFKNLSQDSNSELLVTDDNPGPNAKGILISGSNHSPRRLLSVLEIKKMVPVSDEVLSLVPVETLDQKYKGLLLKELVFIRKKENTILLMMDHVMEYQQEHDRPIQYGTNLQILKEAMKEWQETRE